MGKNKDLWKKTAFILFSIIPVIFYPKISDAFQLPKLAGIFLLTCLIFLYNLLYKRFKIYKEDPFLIPIFLFLSWRIFTVKNCINKYYGIYSILILLLFITFYFNFRNFIEDYSEIKKFLKGIIFASIFISLYGILQVFGIDFINWDIKNTALSTLGRRNFAGEFLVMIFPYLYFLFLSGEKKEKILYFLIGILLFSHLVLTFTRASYIAFFVSSIFFFTIYRKQILIPKKVLLFLLLIFLINPSFSEIKKFEKGTIKSRIFIWKTSLKIIKENLISGTGPGNFEIVFPMYTPKNIHTEYYIKDRVEDAHNDFIEITVESGIIGILLFLFLIFTAFKVYLKNKEKLIALVLLSSIVALSVNALASFPFKKISTLFLFWSNLSFLSFIHFKGEKKTNLNKFLHSLSILYFILFFLSGSFFITRGVIASYYFKKAKGAKNVSSLIKYSEKLVNISPFSFMFNYFTGSAEYLFKGDVNKGIYYLERAKILNPNYDRIYNNLGIIYHRNNQPEKAEENYLKAISLNPNNVETYNNLGSLYIETGKIDKAIDYLEKCIYLQPNFYLAYFNLGMAYYEKKEYKKAKEYFKKTLELKPDFQPAKEFLSKIHY